MSNPFEQDSVFDNIDVEVKSDFTSNCQLKP